mmetsp:Transcript_19210/g.48037  ORF Transcript_19210/g.48037 Transcript_19210/m.48037 type:complete len:337 (-) Transcript_19210:647-1657(-)
MYRKQLFAIHRCIGFVILIGLLECGLWYHYYADWNEDGVRPQTLFICAILSTVAKNIFSQVLVLLASLGWGITQPTLPRNTIFKIQLLTFLYLILDSVREVVLSVRHSLVLPLSFVLLCLIPIAFLHGGILYWIFVALSSLLTELERSRQTAKLDLYLKFWKVLVLSVVILGVSFLYQLYTYSTSIERQLEKQKWSQLWIFTDLVGHALFLLVLVTMMHLWAPSARSHQIAYSHQLAEGDELAVAVGVGGAAAHSSGDSPSASPAGPGGKLGMGDGGEGTVTVDLEDEEEAEAAENQAESFWGQTKAQGTALEYRSRDDEGPVVGAQRSSRDVFAG